MLFLSVSVFSVYTLINYKKLGCSLGAPDFAPRHLQLFSMDPNNISVDYSLRYFDEEMSNTQYFSMRTTKTRQFTDEEFIEFFSENLGYQKASAYFGHGTLAIRKDSEKITSLAIKMDSGALVVTQSIGTNDSLDTRDVVRFISHCVLRNQSR